MPAAVAMTLRCWVALRPGWKVLLSSAAPMWRIGSDSRRYSTPPIVAEPDVGAARPSRIFSVVVFPAPFGPRKPVTLPGWTSNDRSSTARTGP